MKAATMRELASDLGLSESAIAHRLRKGKDVRAPKSGTYDHYIDKEFGKLTVVGISKKDAHKHQMVICECACGAEKTIALKHLKASGTESCGCAHLETLSKGAAPKFVDLFGVQVSIGQLAAMAGRRPAAVWARLRRGMNPQEAAFGRSDRSGE